MPEVLRVERWTAMEAVNASTLTFPVSHRYLELLWTSRLGAMPMVLLRRLSEVAQSDDRTVDARSLTCAIGAPRASGGRRSPLSRSVARLVYFGFAAWTPRDGLVVVTRVPALGERDLARLPKDLCDLHWRFVVKAPQAGGQRERPASGDG